MVRMQHAWRAEVWNDHTTYTCGCGAMVPEDLLMQDPDVAMMPRWSVEDWEFIYVLDALSTEKPCYIS